MKNVILLQRSIPSYRIEFFQKLGAELLNNDIKLQVIHSSQNIMNDELFFYLSPTVDINLSFLRKERFVLCLKLYRHLINIKPSFILTEDISNLPNGLIVTFYCLVNNCSYTIMGLGKILSSKESVLKKILKLPIHFFRKNAKSFLSYSSIGASYYNNLYHKESISWMNSVVDYIPITRDELFDKYQSKILNILFIGRIEKFKRLDLLIDSLIALKDENIVLNIIGEGDEKALLQNKYTQVSFELNWLGRITDPKQKEIYLKKTQLGVMPGSGGLVIQELQANSIPVISSYSDGTEVDLIKNVNPELFIEDMTLEALINKIDKFHKSSIEKKCQVALAAHEVVKNSYNLQNMVKISSNFICKQLN